MIKLILTAALISVIFIESSFTNDFNKLYCDEIQRKSTFTEPDSILFRTSYPLNFYELNNPADQAAISTGYYFVDSDDDAPDYWRPDVKIYDTVSGKDNINYIRRIIQGPRILPREYWVNNPDEGLRFFRNPYFPQGNRSFFDHGISNATDSTDDAIAGPIPLKIAGGFIFNGLRYDSFYVSTNGLIALTNRRYYYDENGNRTIPSGARQCYDPQSNDWFNTVRQQLPQTGIYDTTKDDFGYTYSVCGGSPGSSQLGGIRDRNEGNGSLTNLPYKAAVITPFWGDNQLSQWYKAAGRVDDHGKVYYMRTSDNSKLIIYIINIAPVRIKLLPLGQTYTAMADLRAGDPQYVSTTAQVLLNSLDSSITITYIDFYGFVTAGGKGFPSKTVFRYNTTVGVRGYARHVNYGQAGGPKYPWAGEYEQCTHYFAKYRQDNVSYPMPMLSVKFKQWKNTLRVVDIQYRVRKQEANTDLNFTEVVKSSQVNNFEFLAGEERLAAFQPVGIIQNLSNEIQGPNGINFQPQEVNFRARFRIMNLANGRIIYNRLVPVDSTCLALPDSLSQDCTGDPYVRVRYSSVSKSGLDYSGTPRAFPGAQRYNGIPPYGFVQIYFPPFEPAEIVQNYIGPLRAFLIADPTNPADETPLEDKWIYDDSMSVTLFMMKRLDYFEDDATEFHIIENTPVPSIWKWVNINADVVSGEEVSYHPVPPRGEYAAQNNEQYKLSSPTIRMNRVRLDGSDPSTNHSDYQGDELRSFPINMKDAYGAVLSLSIQRTEKQSDWPRGWCDQQLIGPEPRTMVNGDLLSIFGVRYQGQTYIYDNAVSRYPDEIDVELMQPSPDKIKYITNVPEERWRYHPRRRGAPPVTNVPAYALYGSNGHFVGFLESDRDSALDLENYQQGLLNGLRPDIFDDGIDFEYKKAFVAIPDTFIRSANEGAKNFRFRVKVRASNDKKCQNCIPDDNDNFFVDNVRIKLPCECTEIEIVSVKIDLPFTTIPASQSIAIPIIAKVSNSDMSAANSFFVIFNIYKNTGTIDKEYKVFSKSKIIPYLDPLKEIEQTIYWNARLSGPGNYRLQSIVYIPGGSTIPNNDTTYTDVNIKFGDEISYLEKEKESNDVPDRDFSGIYGLGLSLYGFGPGGIGSIYGGQYINTNDYSKLPYENGSGQISMKFVLDNTDTLKGYKIWFGSYNNNFDDIELLLYENKDGLQPNNNRIIGSNIIRKRGNDDIRNCDTGCWNQFNTFLFDKPVILSPGTYWVAIKQLGNSEIELGASKSRMGMRTTNVYIPPPVTSTNYVGGRGFHLMIDKNLRRYDLDNLYLNNNFCAYENGAGSGIWYHFMPSVGNPGYAHLHHFGFTNDLVTATLSRGTWVPLIKPYFGLKSYSEIISWTNVISFVGYIKHPGIMLVWNTWTERNNKGFYIDRIITSQYDTQNWMELGFVEGADSTDESINYNFHDTNVLPDTTYTYRLRQIDNYGNENFPVDNVTITYKITDVPDDIIQNKLILYQNEPNPFSNYTKINFYLPSASNTKVEILDIFGNVVNVLADGMIPAGNKEIIWYGNNEMNMDVPVGTYICRVIAGKETVSIRMLLIK